MTAKGKHPRTRAQRVAELESKASLDDQERWKLSSYRERLDKQRRDERWIADMASTLHSAGYSRPAIVRLLMADAAKTHMRSRPAVTKIVNGCLPAAAGDAIEEHF